MYYKIFNTTTIIYLIPSKYRENKYIGIEV